MGTRKWDYELGARNWLLTAQFAALTPTRSFKGEGVSLIIRTGCLAVADATAPTLIRLVSSAEAFGVARNVQ